jgi:hypothetical protein
LWGGERCVEDTELRVAPHKIADGNAYIVLAFESVVMIKHADECVKITEGKRTGPEKEKEKWGSATQRFEGLRHDTVVEGSLVRGNEDDEVHNGSCLL